MIKFGSILKDHPEVLKQSKTYPNIRFYTWQLQDFQKIPETFDGRDVWGTYLQMPVTQNCANSWSIVAKDVLGDRLRLSSAGQIVVELSSTEIVSCVSIPPHSKIEGVLSAGNVDYTDSCEGYSIFDAWEFIYANGVTENNCFSYKKLESLNIPTPDKLSFTEKIKKYGKNCENIENSQTVCITKKDGKYLARRVFLSNSIFNVSGNDLDDTIKNIKLELMRFGPVAAGFLVYENFMNSYDGTTIYQKAEGKPLGGHYVSIIGWDKDSWICRNSWGADWGLNGFFKIKMGIPEIMLEDNISGCSPFIYQFEQNKEYIVDGILDGKMIDITDMKNINPMLYEERQKLDVDPKTFYSYDTIKLIEKGELYGDLEPVVKNPGALPNLKFYWVSDLENFNFVSLIEQTTVSSESDWSFTFILILSVILTGILGYISNINKKK